VKQARAAGGRATARATRAEKLMPAKLRPVLDTLLAALGKVEDGTTASDTDGGSHRHALGLH